MCHSPQSLGPRAEAATGNASYGAGVIFTRLNGLPCHSAESTRQLEGSGSSSSYRRLQPPHPSVPDQNSQRGAAGRLLELGHSPAPTALLPGPPARPPCPGPGPGLAPAPSPRLRLPLAPGGAAPARGRALPLLSLFLLSFLLLFFEGKAVVRQGCGSGGGGLRFVLEKQRAQGWD